jgi:hypothetical protein
MLDTVSAKSIKAQMPHLTMTRILSKPTHCQLKQLECELTTNLIAVLCPWGHSKGHLGLLQDPVLYLQYKATPLAYPIIVARATTAKHKELHANNISTQKAWATYMIFHTITHDPFLAAIDNVYYAALDNPIEGLNANAVTLQQLVTHIHTTFA